MSSFGIGHSSYRGNHSSYRVGHNTNHVNHGSHRVGHSSNHVNHGSHRINHSSIRVKHAGVFIILAFLITLTCGNAGYAQERKTEIPILADIPVIGALFQWQELPKDDALALEKAKIFETVERDYVKALEAYQAIAERQSLKPELRERAELGATRCMMKLGQYAEAQSFLQAMTGRELSDDAKAKAKEYLASIRRLSTGEKRPFSSSVDSLVWQLLEAASGTDEKRAESARWEIVKMGPLAVPVLKEAALSPEYYRSVNAFRLLVEGGGEEAIDFLETCAKNPDPALRKRCLDGLITIYVGGRMLPVAMKFLEAEEDVIRIEAVRYFMKYSEDFIQASGKQQEEAVRILGEYGVSDNKDLQYRSFRCLHGIVADNIDYLKERLPAQGDDGFPLAMIAEIIESKLKEFRNKKLLDNYEFDIRETALGLALTLGGIEGYESFLDEVAGFWPLEQHYSLVAAWRSGPKALGAIVQQTVESESPEHLKYILRSCPVESFRNLPEGLQNRFLREAAKRSTDIWRGSEKSIFPFIVTENAPPSGWSAFVGGLLESPNDDNRRRYLLRVEACSDPMDPDCFRTLCKWASHPDEKTRSLVVNFVWHQVKEGRMDPGPKGALEVYEHYIEAVPGPIEVRKGEKRDQIIYTPEEVVKLLSRLTNFCHISAPGLKDWILKQQKPGYLEAVASYATLMYELVQYDRTIALDLWPRVSPLAREVIFNSLDNSLNLNSPSNDWLIPLFKDWTLDPNWKVQNIWSFIYMLYSLRSSELLDRVREAALLMMDRPELQSSMTYGKMSELLWMFPPESDAALEVIPLWQQKLGEVTRGYDPPGIEYIVLASRRNLRSALEWLAGDCEPSFKSDVIDGLCSAIADSAKSTAIPESLHLNEELIKAWPNLDEKIRDEFLGTLDSKRTDTANALKDFFLFLLTNPETRTDRRHLAYAYLLWSHEADVVDPLLAYIKELKLGEVNGARKNIGEFNPAVVKKTSGILSERGHDIYRWRRYLVESLTAEAGQRFCRGILELPVEHPLVTAAAAEVLEISNDDQLDLARKTFQKPWSDETRAELLGAMVSYWLGEGKPEALRALGVGEETLETPDHIIEYLTNALNGRYSRSDDFTLEKKAISLIARYEVKELMTHVGRLAVGHTSGDVREHAIRLLGHLRDPEVVPFLLEGLKDSYGTNHEFAKQYLDRMREYEEQKRAWQAFLGDEVGAVPASPGAELIKMLNHESLEVRLAVIKSLGALRDPWTLPILVKLMAESASEEEKKAAKDAVDAITADPKESKGGFLFGDI